MKNLLVSEFLNNNGIMIEKARREGRSLSSIERNIILAGRGAAKARGLQQHIINQREMDGERDRNAVFTPYKVKLQFAYYYDPTDDYPAYPEYLVLESNHPVLIEGGNFSFETLEKYGIKLPKTPSFEKWVKDGRKCFRGGK